MCLCHDPPRLTRRAALALSAGAALSGCGESGIPIDVVSPEQARKLGLASWQRILATEKRSTDTAKQHLVRQICDRLLRAASERPEQWQIVVFARPQVNAFALPGNCIGVFEGMFGVAANADQLAAVIGHEIGHNQAQHGLKRLNAEAWREMGLRALFTALQLGGVSHAAEIAGALGAGVEYGLVRPFSRGQEIEADRIGVQLAGAAGFDARAAIELWRRMDRLDQGGGPSFLATHPDPAARAAALEKLLGAFRGREYGSARFSVST